MTGLPQTIIVRDVPYAALPRPPERIHEEWQAPRSYAWACPKCGDIWARAVVAMQPFMFFSHPCEAHSDALPPSLIIGGSLWLPLQNGFNQTLSRELLIREFQLHLNHVEKVR